MKNKKGFTLIELLAVIIILGILMIIAIPSVTQYINNSRKSAYVDTAKEIISGARNMVNQGNLEMFDTEATYYLPISCISTENGSKSPYGDFDKAYVLVTYDGKGYNYYWISRDETGQGVKTPVSLSDLDEDDIESDINAEDISTTISAPESGKTIIKVLQSDCNSFDEYELPLCKRAKNLHHEVCLHDDNNGCTYYNYVVANYNESIYYGNETITEGVLNSGDAFDCDVNADGVYDEETERFYYVTKTGSGSNEKAVLIYYSNVVDGLPDNQSAGYSYATTEALLNLNYTCNNQYGCNNYGPVLAYEALPSVTQWSNKKLIAPGTRQIKTDTNTTSTSNGDIVQFTYTNRAARFLTTQELSAACNVSPGNYRTAELDDCKYLFERTAFTSKNWNIEWWWLENPKADSVWDGWLVDGASRYYITYGVNYVRPVRPAIDVLVSDIEY